MSERLSGAELVRRVERAMSHLAEAGYGFDGADCLKCGATIVTLDELRRHPCLGAMEADS